MSCEEINLEKITKMEFEKLYRSHLFGYLNTAEKQKARDKQSMDRLQDAYLNRFGDIAWVLFTHIVMKDYDKIIESHE